MTADELTLRADEFEELGRSLLDHARRLRSLSATREQRRLFWPEYTGELDATAEALFAARRQRSQHLDGTLFSEPAWDMLLFMFQHSKAGDGMTVDQVCRSSGVFASTACRWLRILVDQGLVEVRNGFCSDGMKQARLTELGELRMSRALLVVEGELMLRGWAPSTSCQDGSK